MNPRRLRSMHRSILVTLAALGALTERSGAQQPRADLILVNGRVLTVDASDRIAQAVAVAGSRIVAVGTTAEVERLAAPNARRIDLERANDDARPARCARALREWRRRSPLCPRPELPEREECRQCRRRGSREVATSAKGAWVQGRGWDEGKLAERRLITAKDLDRGVAG